ncbi:uncharacterized protein PAC_00550 [Phialocephala subalpina]|uniref:Uncharacterized protein n=1 Tax=Phialocephala subalpina TaxID=576137 RepID=A0A1L7WD27_9HELO|nr:uncharacterized protein PAC_00550 [Phialocephala subalpina]
MPAWKLKILKHEKKVAEDGSQREIGADWPYVVLATIPRPLYTEDFLPTLSSPQTTEPLSKTTEPPLTTITPTQPYGFTHPFLISKHSFTSRVTFLTIPSSSVPGILHTTRKLNTTLTSLIHALITLFLSVFCSSHSRPILNRKLKINTELSQIPSHGPSALLSIIKIPDLEKYCEESILTPRCYTYELSNIGVVDMPTFAKGSEIRLEKLIFTQCGMPAGPAVACNGVSIKGGPLVLSLTWQEGAIGEDVVAGLREYLERRLIDFDKRS